MNFIMKFYNAITHDMRPWAKYSIGIMITICCLIILPVALPLFVILAIVDFLFYNINKFITKIMFK